MSNQPITPYLQYTDKANLIFLHIIVILKIYLHIHLFPYLNFFLANTHVLHCFCFSFLFNPTTLHKATTCLSLYLFFIIYLFVIFFHIVHMSTRFFFYNQIYIYTQYNNLFSSIFLLIRIFEIFQSLYIIPFIFINF